MNGPGRLALLALAIGLALLPAAEARGRDKVDRSANRAFYTAPPVVPHQIDRYDRDNKSCLRCHLNEKRQGRRKSMKTPHPHMSNCLQCHVSAVTPLVWAQGGSKWEQARMAAERASGFQGLVEPREGSRAGPGAPPTIPHRLFMRENCQSCHSQNHPDSNMRIDHTDRSSCLQCHVPQADRQF